MTLPYAKLTLFESNFFELNELNSSHEFFNLECWVVGIRLRIALEGLVFDCHFLFYLGHTTRAHMCPGGLLLSGEIPRGYPHHLKKCNQSNWMSRIWSEVIKRMVKLEILPYINRCSSFHLHVKYFYSTCSLMGKLLSIGILKILNCMKLIPSVSIFRL